MPAGGRHPGLYLLLLNYPDPKPVHGTAPSKIWLKVATCKPTHHRMLQLLHRIAKISIKAWDAGPHLCAAQGALLDEVLVGPGLGELGGLPGLVDGQQREVVALRLKELGLLLVRLRLLLARPVEDVLSAQHPDDLHQYTCNGSNATADKSEPKFTNAISRQFHPGKLVAAYDTV